MATNIIIINPVQPTEFFVLNADRSLERLAEGALIPEGHVPVFNPALTGLYVEEMENISIGSRDYVEPTGILRHVEKLEKGQRQYEFPEEFIVYMRGL